MHTHDDNLHPKGFMETLEDRADKSIKDGTSQITTGKPGEKPVATWRAANGVHVRHLPNDEQDILRISVGGGDNLPVPMNYLTIRGRVGECIDLLEKAISALRECPE